VVALFAALAYVPLLAAKPGQITADTKQYLYLDPGRLLARAPYLWHPEVHLGTVPHQNIGYLFPAGPYFWVFDRLGVPDWVAQRLWLGSILCFAGLGVLHLLRTLGVRGPGVVVAGLAYMLSPYTLAFASRLSILLLAWAALPWMIALTVRALRTGGWAAPAAFAIVVQVAGSINLTALVLVGIAPVLWVFHAVWVTREVPGRRALAAVGRMGLLTTAASLWWLAALSVQAGFGLNILDYSETVEVVALGGHAGEVLRGLGNWFFYGGDKLGSWIEGAQPYMLNTRLIALGYGLTALGILFAMTVRWRHRTYFAALIVVGVVIGVGVHPFDGPSPLGGFLDALSEGSSLGLALRNVARAIPISVLGLAVSLGVGVNALVDATRRARRPLVGWVAAALVAVLVVLNLPALWNGGFYGDNLTRPEEVPGYWSRAIAALDARSANTRILELPGADFASYRWGNAVEPITPGLTDRAYVARELIPYGSNATADLLVALDRRLQRGLLEPAAVAPLARLLSVGDIVLRNDLQTDRFDLARPAEMAALFATVPGLGVPSRFGSDLGPALRFTDADERTLALPAETTEPAPVEIFPVLAPRSLLRAEAAPVLVVSGNGDGLVDLAAAGLLDGDPLVRYSASGVSDPAALRRAIRDGAVLVVTDTNRKRAQRWGGIVDVVGFTERVGETPERDTSDHRLDLFPAAPTAAYTVVRPVGAVVEASAYATPHLDYLPADRPARALDGDVHTAWRVGRFTEVVGEWIEVTPVVPVTTDRVSVVQPLDGPRDRWITTARLEFRDEAGRRVGDDVVVDLTDASRTPEGQEVVFPERRFARLRVVVEGVSGAFLPWAGSAVGLAEIRIPGVAADEVVRMPRDLVRRPEAGDLARPLVYVMTRLRNRVGPPNITTEEATLVREFEVPAARAFGVSGQARVSNLAPDDRADEALGYPGVAAGGIAVRSSDRVRTTLATRGSAAVDGDPTTAWTTPFGEPVDQWLEVDLPGPVRVDRLDLRLVADGGHSVPTRLRIDGGGQTRVVDVPAVADAATPGAVAPVTVAFDPLVTDRLRVTVEAVRPVEVTEYYADLPQLAPVGVAELGVPGVVRPVPGPAVPEDCRRDLLTVDDEPVAVRVRGDRGDAAGGGLLAVEACDPAGIRLGPGRHVLRAAAGARTGFDLDRIVLASGAGGAASSADRIVATAGGGDGTAPTPRVRIGHQGRTAFDATVTGVDGPFTLVLGESLNPGWSARADGRDLGPPTLVDGFANGWRIDPGDARTVAVELTWTPQRRIWIALALSAATLLVCAVIVVVAVVRSCRRRAGPGGSGAAGPDEVQPALGWPAPGAPPRPVATVGTVLVVTVVGALVAAPWVGPVAGVATAVVLVWPRLRPLLAVGAVGSVAATGAYVVIQQTRYRYPPIIEWPTFLDRVHLLALLAVVLVAVDVAVEVVSRRARPTGPGPVPEATTAG
jgi:arabinofuranan 3-O-arabinosyltransferase